MEQLNHAIRPQGVEEDQLPASGRGGRRAVKYFAIAAMALTVLAFGALSVRLVTENQELEARISSLREQLARAEQLAENLTGNSAGDGAALPPEAECPPWQDLYPELYAQPAALGTVDEEKTVYLTFDDGPSARTREILEILEEYGVKATFFVVGKEDERSKQWMRDIVAAGHTLGVHSYSHVYKEIYASVEDYLADFSKIYDLIFETTGVAPQIFRFPGGSINGYNASTYSAIIGEMVRRGFVYFDWNVSSGDAVKGGVSAAVLTANCLSKVKSLRRAVVLMHDSASRTTTVEALPRIIEGYQRAGFTFAPLTPEVKPVVYAYPD